MWQLLTRKSGFTSPKCSKGIWPIPCAPSTRLKTLWSLQDWTNLSHGTSTLGRLETTSNIATLAFLPSLCIDSKVSSNFCTSLSSVIGYSRSIFCESTDVDSHRYSTVFSQAPYMVEKYTITSPLSYWRDRTTTLMPVLAFGAKTTSSAGIFKKDAIASLLASSSRGNS